MNNQEKHSTTTTRATIETPTVIGLGTFGAPLAKELERKLNLTTSKKPKHLDKDPTKDAKADGTLENVAVRLLTENPRHIVMAISAENQQTEGIALVEQWIANSTDTPQDLKIAIQINSVQAPIRHLLQQTVPDCLRHTPVAVISLHPYHGAINFADTEKNNPGKPKVWILTGIDIFNPNNPDNNAEYQKEARDYVKSITEALEDVTLIDLTGGYTQTNGEYLDGSQFHDYIAAYYQAVFHMVKLTPGITKTEWYQQHFANVKASPALSEAVINSNPYAQKVAKQYTDLLANDFSPQNILRVAITIINEGEKFIPEEYRGLKTANVKKLENLFHSKD